MKWESPAPNWDTVAGRLLDRFFECVSRNIPGYDAPLTVFGSAAIQLCHDENFTSADVDLMVTSEQEELRALAKQLGVGRSGSLRRDYGLQICPPQMFQTTPHYLQRARVEPRHGVTVVVPHVRDILVGKLHRFRREGQDGLAPKDRRAFERVRALCEGRPSETDMLEDLQLCEPSLHIPGDGSLNCFRLNALDLFHFVYRRRLDLDSEVLEPARLKYAQAAGDDEIDVDQMLDDLNPHRD